MFNGLYGVFWDSLPDGWGELLLTRFLAKQGLNPEKISVLTKLTLIGKNGLGGLTYGPTQRFDYNFDGLDFDELSKQTDKILNNENTDLDKIYYLGGSSGGARPKAHIKIGNEEWIIKFPCRIDPINAGEKEFIANKTAKKCGINVSEYKLFPSKLCTGYFGTKRFDRHGGKRIHTISLSGVLETTHKVPTLDYTHLFQVIKAISANVKKDMYEAFLRMCFNVFYQNKDDHGKNFAFLYDDNLDGYTLSPAYDLTKTPEKYEHEMTVNGIGNPTKKDLLAVAEQFKLSKTKCKEIIDLTEYFCK